MMAKPDSRTIEALASLEGNHNFETVMEWIESSLQQTLAQLMIEHDEVIVRKLQGAASDLKDFTDTARQARKLIANNR